MYVRGPTAAGPHAASYTGAKPAMLSLRLRFAAAGCLDPCSFRIGDLKKQQEEGNPSRWVPLLGIHPKKKVCFFFLSSLWRVSFLPPEVARCELSDMPKKETRTKGKKEGGLVALQIRCPEAFCRD